MEFLPDDMRSEIPIINADPDHIYDVLKEWLTTHKRDLRYRGLESRKYAEKWHDPKLISRSIMDDCDGVRCSK